MKKTTINKIIASIIALAAIVFLTYYFFLPFDDEPVVEPPVDQVQIDQLLAESQQLLREGKFEAAEIAAQKILRGATNQPDALIVAGEATTQLKRYSDALNYYDNVSQENRDLYITATWAMGEILTEVGHLSEAEAKLQIVLSLNPAHLPTHRRLAALYSLAGRRWDSKVHYEALLKARTIRFPELMQLTTIQMPLKNLERLEQARKAAPDDLLPMLGQVVLDFSAKKIKIARTKSAELIAKNPNLIEAQIIQGKTLLEENMLKDFLIWQKNLPPQATLHPEIWFIYGKYQELVGNQEEAIRSYWEALARNPNHAHAAHRISRLLPGTQYAQRADQFYEHSRLVVELQKTASEIKSKSVTPELVLAMAKHSEALGRYPEAFAWRSVVGQFFPMDQENNLALLELQRIITPITPLVANEFNIAMLYDLSSFPKPDWKRANESPPTALVAENAVAAPQFNDVAAEVGIDFRYDNGDDLATPGLWIYQEMGGGVVVLDYDRDGWQDFYLTQGGEKPFIEDESQPTDRLFRNLGNGHFEDVTESAMLGDRRYGQGASAGDFNNDGFPDIIVANIGKNRLYENQGDGTFRDVTDAAGLGGELWSSCCVIADINKDNLPDIYFATYISGKKAYETQCEDGGRPRACRPNSFQAEQDRVYYNQGDGTFRDVTESNGFTAANGRALGILVGNLEGNGDQTVFVANDTTDNFYFRPESGKHEQFIENASLTGVATDADGAAQACMGVAVDDANGDGLLDMYITNFFNESNTLYLQAQAGLFIDDTLRSGLRGPSISRLGFGTQFIDVQLDGWPDLFVANGHVDDYTHLGTEFVMAPQYFHNLGQGKFVEIPNERLGDYFNIRCLGRSVALTDWDRDGRQDLAVLHLDKPFSLLSNQSSRQGNFVSLTLEGSRSSRDAFGAWVEFKLPQRTIVKHLVAGSGYYASNQRVIHAGLGEVARVPEMVVHWPSGEEQTFKDVAVDREYCLIESKDELIELTQ